MDESESTDISTSIQEMFANRSRQRFKSQFGLKEIEQPEDESMLVANQDPPKESVPEVRTVRKKKKNKKSISVPSYSNPPDTTVSTQELTHDVTPNVTLITSTQSTADVTSTTESYLSVLLHATDRIDVTLWPLRYLQTVVYVMDYNQTCLLQTAGKTPVLVNKLISKRYDLFSSSFLSANWEERLVFDVPFSLISQEPTYPVCLLFSLLGSTNTTPLSKQWSSEFQLGWAYLRLFRDGRLAHAGSKRRLQLYAPVVGVDGAVDLLQLSTSGVRACLSSTLYVTVSGFSSAVPPTENPSSIVRGSEFPPPHHVTGGCIPDRPSLNSTQVVQQSAELSPMTGVKVSGRVQQGETRPTWQSGPTRSGIQPNTLMHSLQLGGCTAGSFSPSGDMFAVAHPTRLSYVITLFTFPTFETCVQLSSHQGHVYSLDWVEEGKALLSCSADCTVKLWRPQESSSPCSVLPHASFVYCAVQHPVHHELIVTGSYDGILRAWQLDCYRSQPARLLRELVGHSANINAVVFSASGITCASGCGKGEVILWQSGGSCSGGNAADVASSFVMMQRCALDELGPTAINALHFLHGGQQLVVNLRCSAVLVYDLRTDSVVTRLQGFQNNTRFVRSCLSPCETYLFSGSEDGCVVAWRLLSTRLVFSKNVDMDTVLFVSVHPQEQCILVGGLGLKDCAVYMCS